MVSDPTDEFPENTNASFKVRLPVPLGLTGSGWHVALLSLAFPSLSHNPIPSLGESNTRIATVVFELFDTKKATEFQVYFHVTFGDIMTPVTKVTGEVEFWQRMAEFMVQKMQYFTQYYTQKRERMVLLNENSRPSFKWNGNTMTVQATKKGSSKVSPYKLRLSVDLMTKFGCLVRQAHGSYDLGPNHGYELAET